MTSQINDSYNMTPVQEVFMSFQIYLLAIYTHIGFRKEKLSMDILRETIKFNGYNIPSPWNPKGEFMKEDISIVADNLYRLAFANLFGKYTLQSCIGVK